MNGTISAYDSSLFRNIFTSDRMRAEFSKLALWQGHVIVADGFFSGYRIHHALYRSRGRPCWSVCPEEHALR